MELQIAERSSLQQVTSDALPPLFKNWVLGPSTCCYVVQPQGWIFTLELAAARVNTTHYPDSWRRWRGFGQDGIWSEELPHRNPKFPSDSLRSWGSLCLYLRDRFEIVGAGGDKLFKVIGVCYEDAIYDPGHAINPLNVISYDNVGWGKRLGVMTLCRDIRGQPFKLIILGKVLHLEFLREFGKQSWW